MPVTTIVRIPRKDPDNSVDFVLVHVEQESLNSSRLTLDATEGEYAYTAIITQEDLNKSRAKAFKGSDEELQSVVLSLLTRRVTATGTKKPAQPVEAVATVQPEQSIAITFRQRIEGITPDVCSISLRYTDDDARQIQLYDWTGHLANQLNESEAEKRQLERSLEERSRDTAELRAQLNDMVEGKRFHENELLEKFRQLLNSKKLKIRDQQRLLAGAKIDPSLGSTVKSSRNLSGGQSGPLKTRSAKRKAPEVKDESDSSEGFENTGLRRESEVAQTNGGDSDDEHATTPQDSDAEGTEEEEADAIARTQTNQKPEQNPAENSFDPLPPRRNLPFNSKPDSSTAPELAEDDETDDEL